jgi:hypothetical protein
MSRYFFDVRGRLSVLDQIGKEFPDRPAALEYAAQLARRIRDSRPANWEGWRVCVREGVNEITATMPLVRAPLPASAATSRPQWP